jgi:hypothetical protein
VRDHEVRWVKDFDTFTEIGEKIEGRWDKMESARVGRGSAFLLTGLLSLFSLQ